MAGIPVQGEIYQHFKGNLYRIVTLAEHSETGEQMVVYQALYGDFKVYARPLTMFMSEVDHEKYPDVQVKYRYTPVPAAGAPLMEPQKNTAAHPEEGPQKPALKDQVCERTAEQPWAVPYSGSAERSAVKQEEEFQLDSGLLAFLEADSYEKKLEVFAALAGKVDEAMLNTIAVSLDLELSGDDLEEQYETLKNCLLTLEKYECSRLR